jgi:hypothetical protein
MLKKILKKLFGFKSKAKIIKPGKKNKNVLIYNSGQSFVNDDITGQDIERAGKNWFLVYLEYLESVGVDPLECNFIFENGKSPVVYRMESLQDGQVVKKINYYFN